ncbi:hypothetical protein A4U53_005525 (plasmid) [Rhizobium ruizarguesonis]|uniref:Uncharacterized protein n=1 Tax=Rhizobium ruizarguesonis TaxID=2081791 RepID=A0ACD5EH44_9HYPH
MEPELGFVSLLRVLRSAIHWRGVDAHARIADFALDHAALNKADRASSRDPARFRPL